MRIIKLITDVIYAISLCGVLIAGALGAVYEIVGYAKFQDILSRMGIAKGFERIWAISGMLLCLFIVTYFLKTKIVSS